MSAGSAFEDAPALMPPPCAQKQPVFELSGISYRYADDVPALDDVSLTVAAGERLALLGANGSGKSTLLWVLAGLLEPAGGELCAFGVPLKASLHDEGGTYAFRRRVGIVFQNADAQLFSPTVRDEVAFGPLHLGLDRDEALVRVQDTLRLLDIEALAARAPYGLSGGEKKKVALAAALAVNPDVLLLDEPLGELDPRSREWLVELLALLHVRGKTLVSATHDLDLVHELADRAAVLGEDHRLAAEGDVGTILADRGLLLGVNLIHEHAHRHGTLLHSHAHAHLGEHVHGVREPAVHEHVHQSAAPGQPADLEAEDGSAQMQAGREAAAESAASAAETPRAADA